MKIRCPKCKTKRMWRSKGMCADGEVVYLYQCELCEERYAKVRKKRK